MKVKNKHFGRASLFVLLAVVFFVFAGVQLSYANILFPKQGINEYHFYNDAKENKEKAEVIQKQIITNGKKLSDPGHVFKGQDKVLLKWQDETGNDIKFDTPIEITGNDRTVINVYPVFKNQVVITYHIYNKVDGKEEDKIFMTDTIARDDKDYKLPTDPTIYDTSKYFVHWSTSKDDSSGEYNDESLQKDLADGKKVIDLYAITVFKHKATFITGEDATFQEQILASNTSTLDKQPETPERPGYKFSHWSLTENGDPVDLSTYKLEKDITVYAVWTPIVVDYKFKVMVQNIDDDGYTFHEIISARGLNGDKTTLPYKGAENPDPKVAPSGPIVEDIATLTEKDGRFNSSYNSKDSNGEMNHNYTNSNTLDYPGFHLNEAKTAGEAETIKADGSTVVPVYMDRNVHTIWVYKNKSAIGYYQANWVNATDNNGNIHVDLRYGQSSDKWFNGLNKDYVYYMDKSIGSFYTKAPVMGDQDIYMYRVYAKGTKYQLRFVEWDPSKFNAQINSSDIATMQSTLGTMKEIGKRVSFQNSEWYMNWNGYKYRVYEPYNGNYQQITYSWVDKTDHVDDIEGFDPKKGDMSRDGLQSVNVNNPAFRDYMFAAGKNVGGYQNYTGTPYIENDTYVGFLFYIRKSYKINYYSGNKKITSKSYKYEAPVIDFGLDYKVGETKNPDNSKQVFKGWYKDSTFSVPYTAEDIKTMPAHDTNVYAKWESVEYKVTFHTNQNDYADNQYIEEVTNIPDSKTIYDGQYNNAKASEDNLPKPVKPNENAKEFLGWYEKNQYGRYIKANLHKPIKNNNTHLYARWIYEYLKLTYDLNLPSTDKVDGKAPTDKNSYIKDAKAQAQDVGAVKVNDGKKVFVGWSESKDGSTGLIKPSETVLMDKNKTLYAQWKEIKDAPLTKVTYDPNGGKGSQYTVDKIIVEDFHKVLDNDKDENLKYSREGYAFKGWSRDKAATKAEFQAGEEVNVNQLEENKNNYIYAIWAPIINYTTDGNGQVKEGENFVDNTKEEVELKANPKGTETKAKDGYKFSHWTADKEITLNDGTKIPAGGKITEEQLKQAVITEPLTFKANFVQDEFKVKHEFKVADDSPVKEMPAEVKTAVNAQLPEDKTAKDGSVVTPTAPTQTEIKDTENDGTWNFEGYKDQDTTTDEVDAKVNGADVTFEGSWKFTPNKHQVTYEYVSGTEGKELPEALKAKAPAEVTGKVKGDTVTSPVPTGKDAEYRDDVNKGTWKFKSFDKDSVTISNKDEKVTGTWEFTPDPAEYNVKHEFVSSTEGKTLPDSVKALLPKEQTGKKDGEAVTPTAPTQTEVKDTENDGIWKFEGYKDQDTTTDEVDAKVNGADVTFEGSWKFTPNKHEVTYEYVSGTKGVELPAELKAKAPAEVTGKVKGDTVTSPVPTGKDAEFRDDVNKGTWKFKSFDKDSVTISNKDEKVTGTWEFTPDPAEYNVKHEFVSSTEGKTLPDSVKALLPKEQTGKKDGEAVTPTAPTQTEVKDTENDGTWNFEGYKDQDTTTDEVDAKVNGADVTFEGSWKFTPNKHEVTYEYVSGTKGVELPAELKAKAPAEVTGKVKGDTVTSPVPTGKDAEFRDDVNKGTWKFKSFDKDSVTISNKDEKVTGTWEFTPDPAEYNVKHEFVSSTEGKTLPDSVKALLPKEQTGKKDGEAVTPTAPTQTEVKDTENDGTWNFEGYKDQDTTTDEVDAKVNGADVTFEGSWKFTPNKHQVTYEYVSGTEGKELPEALKAKAPAEVTGKVKGDTVTSPVPTGKDAEYRDDVNKGTWKFKSFDKDSVTISNKDEKVTGTWEFTPDPAEYNVKHEFVSSTEGKTLPDSVKALLPKEQTGKKDGETVTPTAPTQTEVVDAQNDGTWTFEGYKDQDTTTDEVDAKVNGSDVTFEGKWKFTPNKHQVTYKFVSEDPTKTLPKEVTDLLPDPEKGKVKGENVTPTKPIPESITTKDGVWTFVKYDKDSETVGDKDVEFTGTWKFTQKPDPVTYNVNHQFKSATEGKDLPQAVKDQLPDQQTGKKDGETVTPTAPTQTEVKDADNDGTWTFKGYKDQDTTTEDVDAKVASADVMFEGSWEFTPNKHEVIHKFVSKDPNKQLPKEVTDLLPTNQTGKVKGDEVAPTEPTTKTVNVEDGTWTFVSYDKTKDTVDNKDVEFTGTWEFTPKTTPTDVVTEYVDENGNTIAPKENGKQTNKDIVGYEFVRTETDDKGNTKHIYKKKTTTPTEVVTEYVDENGNTIAPKVNGKQSNKDIDGYEFVRTETDDKGNTKHIYKKKTTTPTEVVTEYVDENGNTIAPKVNGKQTNKDIDGYEFVRTETDANGNTKHIYKKKTTTPTEVVTEYVDENGNTIAPKVNGKQTNKDIDGYEFVRTETDANGNTKHIYKKKTTTPTEVVTEYVDENGNTIAPKVNGKQTNKDIEGYEFVRTETDANGNTKHIYKKKTTTPTEVVTEYVDENGNTIAPKVNGKQTNKDIDGYVFVRTETDANGNTKHIYKKKAVGSQNNAKPVDKNGNQISKSILGDNPKTGIAGLDDVVVLALMGSAIALHKIRKYK
ncbi:SHIRT domain-containing protein [Levyella massiliensis]|uniref:SHIRT domain-containing protein n=1 Tax=Levyella massiliensis TaxID=938289 RepID=UPI003EBD12C7